MHIKFHLFPRYIYTSVNLPWEDNGLYIYADDSIQNKLNMHGKGKISGKRVFFGGLYMYLRENRAWKAFWASVLKYSSFWQCII